MFNNPTLMISSPSSFPFSVAFSIFFSFFSDFLLKVFLLLFLNMIFMVVDEHDDDDSYRNRQFREWNTIPPTHTECSSLSFLFVFIFSLKNMTRFGVLICQMYVKHD
uniref:Transmembrane protein n=1 Tax=Opuntia streptacantha TaxID=393608 RepID=A0A7C9A5N2_OPUST